MSRRFKFFGVVVILLCLAAVIVGWIPVSSASEIEAYRPTSALADTQSDEQEVSSTEDEGVQVVYAFSAEDSELPEGLTIDKSGNIYAAGGTVPWWPTTNPYGAVWKISPDGEKTTLH